MQDICYCFTDSQGSYYRNAVASIISVFEHASQPVTAHVISDETLTESNKKDFTNVAERYGHTILFYSLKQEIDPAIRENVSKLFGVGSLYGLFIPELIPEDKVLTLDCDVLATLVVGELFRIPLDEACLAAVLDGADDERIHNDICANGMDPAYYVNSGVLLMNTKLMREKFPQFKQAVLSMVSEKKMMFPDQHAINSFFPFRRWLEGTTANDGESDAKIVSIFLEGHEAASTPASGTGEPTQGTILVLPAKFNYRLSFIENSYQPLYAYEGKLVHFTGDKPWKALYPGALLYWKYYCRYFPAADAFAVIEKQKLHELTPMFHYMVRERSARRLFNRCYQISKQGVFETILDRIFPARRKKKRLNNDLDEFL